MSNQSSESTGLIVKMVISAWDSHLSRISKLLNDLTDEQIALEPSPGKNSGIYILGHLIAVTDAMLPLLGLGEKLYPELEALFIKSPDKSGKNFPATSELRKYWKDVHQALSQKMASLSAAEWLMRHTAVSESDFSKEPHRNRLNVLISRTNHLGYHWGQLVYLKGTKGPED